MTDSQSSLPSVVGVSQDPFVIEGPAVISFSGGRTSGYMLRRILDAGLRPDVHIVYANTGKEREETLDFIEEVSQRWGVHVRWVEWMPEAPRFKEVTYATAARKGEPFEALITSKQMLTHRVTRSNHGMVRCSVDAAAFN